MFMEEEMITVYTKEGCPKCKILKMKLAQKGIEYNEVNDLQQMIAMGIKSAPQMDVDGVKYEFAEAIKYVNER